MQNHSRLPVAGLVSLAAALLAAGSASAADAFHRVEAGNTLFSIAQSHGVTVEALRVANGLKGNSIQVGQRLRLPGLPLADHHEGEGHEHEEGKQDDEHHSALNSKRALADESEDDEHGEDEHEEGKQDDEHHSALDAKRAVADKHEGEGHEHEEGKQDDEHHSALDAKRAVADKHEGEGHEHEEGKQDDEHHSALDAKRAVADKHEGEGHEHEEGKQDDEHHSALPGHREVAWGYGPEDGPRNWARLGAGFSLCGVGKNQAPIDLQAGEALTVGLMRPVFDWGSAAGRVVADAQGLRFIPTTAAGLEIDGRRYELGELRLLSPSEHTLGGARLAGELQFVHTANDGGQAIVSVLLERRAANEGGVLLPRLPARGEGSIELEQPFELAALLPADRRAFRYEGSLSTPPCTEGVKWIVLRQPLSIGKAMLTALRERAASAVRPVQPRNGRALLVDSSP